MRRVSMCTSACRRAGAGLARGQRARRADSHARRRVAGGVAGDARVTGSGPGSALGSQHHLRAPATGAFLGIRHRPTRGGGVFRLALFRLAAILQVQPRPVALGSAVVFGLMHRRFGRWFVGYACIGGLVLWATYARTGYWGAVLLHAVANLVDLSVGWRRWLYAAGSGGTAQTPPGAPAGYRPADHAGGDRGHRAERA